MIETGSGSRAAAARMVREAQAALCARAEHIDGAARFVEDAWERPEGSGAIAGSGSTRVLADGSVFERGGVNTSVVSGSVLPPSVVAQRPELAGHGFFAAGVSLVLHPRNPNVPTVHMNVRYFEARSPGGERSAWWFGGGADLTPYYPVLEDVRHFHGALRGACERHDPRLYPAFKAWCDRYFFLKHRNETRGVGGIFFDYLDAHGFGESDARTAFDRPWPFERALAFAREVADTFGDAYFPLVERRRGEPYGERERAFQLLRRGRYVEFNLIYDRGTHFGLQSGGRTESILMSLPPLVRWAYDERPEAGSREAQLTAYLRPRDWFAGDPLREE